MPKKSQDRSADVNQLAAAIVQAATEESPEMRLAHMPDGKNAAAVALGRLGGKIGGPARARKLTKSQRSEIAKKAALTRWKQSEG